MSELPKFFDAIELTARGLLINALRETNGNQKQAAERLGMKRTTFIERMRQHQITPQDCMGIGLTEMGSKFWKYSAFGVWDLVRVRAEIVRARRYLNSLEYLEAVFEDENDKENQRTESSILKSSIEGLDKQSNGHCNGLDLPD